MKGRAEVTFEELLSRAAEQTLQQMVGRRTVRLLAKLDPALTTPDRLLEIVLGLHSPADMLLNAETRSELLMLLREREASSLCLGLGLAPCDDAFDALQSMKIRRGSARASELLDFFCVAEDSPAEDYGLPTLSRVKPTHSLFPHQRLAARRVARALDEEPNRVLLHMPTGSGKTRTAMNVICEQLNRSEPMLVVWLAHSEELCEQAVDEFTTAWSALGNRDLSVHRWWGDHVLDPQGARDGLVVAGLSKVYSAATTSFSQLGLLAGRVGLVIMDEAHQAIAPTYQMVLDVLTNAGRPASLLGLSATPGRTWNDVTEDERLAEFFFRRRVRLEVEGFANPVDYLVSEGYLAKTEFESLYHRSGVELSERDRRELVSGLEIPARIVRYLAEDEQRNLLILHRTEQLLRQHDRVLLFAATVEHALVLATALRARGAWAHAVTGMTPSDERARLISEFRGGAAGPRVLVNYGVLTTGFDAPRTSAALIARPTKSLVLYSQMVGRATRGPRAGGNAIAQITTVVDTALPGFSSMGEAFNNWEDIW